MEYEVWIGCTYDCPNYEEERNRKTTNDPVEAINFSIMLRDNNHYTEIRIKREH